MPWADCDAPASGAATGWRFHAIAAHRAAAQRRRRGRRPGLGRDHRSMRSSSASGPGLARADVTVLGTGGTRCTAPTTGDSTAAAARPLPPGDLGSSSADRWVRRLNPAVDQPLPLVISLPREDPHGVYAVIAAVVLLAGLLAGGAAWWVIAAQPALLRQLADAADQIADGNAAAGPDAGRGGDSSARRSAQAGRPAHPVVRARPDRHPGAAARASRHPWRGAGQHARPGRAGAGHPAQPVDRAVPRGPARWS